MSVSGGFSFCNENGNKTCQKYTASTSEADALLLRILNDYINAGIDPTGDFSMISIGGSVVYTFEYTLPGSIDVVVTASEDSTPSYMGSFVEGSGSPTTISFTGNVGTFTDSSGDSYTMTLNNGQFTLENNTDGWIFDSSTVTIVPN